MSALDVQAALDQIAQLMAGSTPGTGLGVFTGSGLMAGGQTIRFGYSRLPEPGSLGQDGLVAICFWDGAEIDGGQSDLVMYHHRIRIQITLSLLRSALPVAWGILTPFLDPVRDTIASHVKLNGAADNSQLISVSGVIDSIYAGRIALEFILRVTQKEAVAFAA